MGSQNKRIRYRHVRALRDLSKCFNFNNIKIKKGQIYRSAYLGKLTDHQVENFIKEFNVGYVIDLRTEAEINAAPDMKSDSIEYYHIPILEEFDNPLITKENRNGILLDITKNKGGAIKYLDRVYRKMVTDEYCLSQFRKCFDVFLSRKDDRAIVFHCAQGKDRTGVLAALFLYAVGYDKSSIIYDYRRFNNAYRFKNFLISVIVAFRFMSIRASRDLYFLQMAHRKLIQASFEEMYKAASNRTEYLNNMLKLSNEDIAKLKDIYLIKE